MNAEYKVTNSDLKLAIVNDQLIKFRQLTIYYLHLLFSIHY
jgi:hypothetical protein